MKRLVPLLSLLVAVAVVGAAGWLLLHGEPGPSVPVPPEPPSKPAAKPPVAEDPLPEFAPLDPDPGDPRAENLEPKEIPLPPDAYPWEVPGWWHEIDRRLRDKEIVIEEDVLPVKDILAFIEKEILFPVRAGPELEEWAADSRLSLPSVHAPARAVQDGLRLAEQWDRRM